MKKWWNKVAIVTGASVGLGKDVSLRLVSHGLQVVGCGRNFDSLLKMQSEIPVNSPGNFVPFKCDVSKEDEVLKMFDFVKTKYKELSILINNAGFSLEGQIVGGKTEHWKSMFETNVLGLCMCTREAVEMMRKNEIGVSKSKEIPGHIINMNSIVGHVSTPVARYHFYSGTKYAVRAITEAIRLELREIHSNIRVTQISPGVVDTQFAIRSSGEEGEKFLKTLIPELLEASDVTDAVIFTLSAEPRNSINDILMRPVLQTL